MTQEEKAKAYDEALERARQIKDGKDEWRYSDLIEITPALTDIFPQLSESEDERIRKALIDGVRQIRCKNGITQEQMIAYLEKQEQKPAWSEELDIDTLREWSMRYAPDIRQAIESTAYHFYNLRPHWKPSEEQLNALNFAITYFMHETNYKNPTELRDLYDELLKLK